MRVNCSATTINTVTKAISAGDATTLAKILDADPEVVSSRLADGNTLLHVACKFCNVQAVALLLKHGADVNDVQPATFRIPLHYAALSSDHAVVQVLVDHCANIEHRSSENCTPLHYACMLGSPDVVARLIELGADIESESLAGNKPLHLAYMFSRADVVRVLLENGADPSSLNDRNETPEEMVYPRQIRDTADDQ